MGRSKGQTADAFSRMAQVIWRNVDDICQAKVIALDFKDKGQQAHRNYMGSVGVDELCDKLGVSVDDLVRGAGIRDLKSVGLWRAAENKGAA